MSAVPPFPPSSPSINKSEILYGVENAVGRGVYFMSNVKQRMDIFFDYRAPSIVVDIAEYRNGYIDIKRRGGKIRAFTEITKDNVHHCKELMKLVDELRHLDGVRGGMAVSESEYMATTVLQEAKPLMQVIYSNVKEVVEQGQYIFDTLWNAAIPAEQRIKEIEEGVETEFTKVITDGNKVAELIVELAKSVKREAQMLLPNSNAITMVDELGIWDYLIQAAKEKGADIRVLCHMSNSNEIADDIVRRISSQAHSIRIFSTPSSEAILFIVDNEKFLRIEEKDTGAHTPTHVSDAVSLAIWSNSKKGTVSFKSIFDILWEQTDLYQQLKVHDKMQKEFINVAAHELRTPIQPILGLSEVLQSKIKDNEQRLLVDVISRNAKRLQRLTEDILDVTKIESQSLNLKKEIFNLNEVVINVLAEYGSRTGGKNNVKITFVPKGDFVVQGDRGRLGQVLSNLMNNAIKFTKEGNIDISLEKLQNDKDVILSVKDTGSGIDPDILPRLFTKFATKSHIGTGLGLYISKNIIEAHGGRIWAENNSNGKGATFSFSLPIFKT